MKVYTFVTGLHANGEPALLMSTVDLACKGWTLIDTREVHFNIGSDEILKLAKEAQVEIDMASEQYATEANEDHITSEQFPNV